HNPRSREISDAGSIHRRTRSCTIDGQITAITNSQGAAGVTFRPPRYVSAVKSRTEMASPAIVRKRLEWPSVENAAIARKLSGTKRIEIASTAWLVVRSFQR